MATISSFTRPPETEQYGAFGGGSPETIGNLLDAAGNPDFAAIRENPEFLRVRRSLLRFTVPMSVLFLCWYMTYVLLAAYAPEFMGHRVTGSITLGLLLGLSQFLTTVVIMLLYLRFAKRVVDPQVAALREQVGRQRS